MIKVIILTLVFTRGHGLTSEQFTFPNAQTCAIARNKWISLVDKTHLDLQVAACQEGYIVK